VLAVPIQSHSYPKIAAVLAAILIVAAIIFWIVKQRTSSVVVKASQRTVAVLPLQNLGSDKDVDYLRLALADEIATSLSYVRSLTIRPFATTSKYDSPTVDLQEAGRAMHVTDVVTGHYMKQGDQIQITLEAVDIADNRTVWRDTMTVPAPDLISMRSQITAKVRQDWSPPSASEPIRKKPAHILRTKKLTIFICEVLRCPMILFPIKTPLPCWSAPSASTPPTRPPGDISEFATITTEPIRTAARPCSSAPTPP
jgi:TolB-like protein